MPETHSEGAVSSLAAARSSAGDSDGYSFLFCPRAIIVRRSGLGDGNNLFLPFRTCGRAVAAG